MTADRQLPEAIPDRLYGRRRGHPLRERQQRLLDVTLPRLAATPDQVAALPRPLWIEAGFGGGEHVLAQIAANPHVSYVASEVFENGLCSLLSRLVPEGGEGTAPLPPNLRLWAADARHLLAALPRGSVDRLFLMFPDPWPKSRHAKRRFVHPALLPVVANALPAGAEWRIASDDPTYQAWVEEVLEPSPLFDGVQRARSRPADWPGTRYEAKALAAGRTPIYWIWRRTESASTT
ncbi:MAG: tRNA (guanine(46)-N(7))-methyltransferase TrmB [Acetobacteraceae bacterium]|nr:tRNA (guanine(46)-N(7))-methyltransferase TrmB [Acetobacteraceae bacterium]